MVTLSSCLIWQITGFILPPNVYGCVYAWTILWSRPAIDLQKKPILAKKNYLFRWSSFWFWRVYKQAKLSHLGHRKPARIHWKADASKTSHFLVRILGQKYNWAIFLRKWASRIRYSQWRSLSDHIERIFGHKSWRGGYWQHLVLTGRRYVEHRRNYTRCFVPCFWKSHYQPQNSYDNWSSHLGAAIWHNCTQSIMYLKIGPIV